MIKFGPSGSGESFALEGYKSTVQLPEWLSKKGLDIFEYSFGRGVNIGEAKALEIGEQGKKYGVEITAHAPYYINFASAENDKVNATFGYMSDSMKVLRLFGGNRCIFHIGSPKTMSRRVAMDKLINNIKIFTENVYREGMNDLFLCPETMGKINQLGSIDEIIEVCKIDKIYKPCIDFGHVNSREGGILRSKDDYIRVFSEFADALGFERIKNLHIHFSHIEYTIKGGELRHLTNADTVFGPYFEHCAEAVCELGLEPYIISESAGTQDIDSVENMNIFNEMRKKFK